MLRQLLLPALLMFVIFSCKKTTVSTPDSNRVLLDIPLSTGYLASGDLDSAVIWWETGADKQFYKIIGHRDTLKADLSAFRKGDGFLTIQLFSKKRLNGQPLQFEKRMNRTLSFRDVLSITGPAAITDPAWNPRVFLSYQLSAGNRYTGIVGLRPSDPYFEIKDLTQGDAVRLKVHRSFYRTGETTPVASKTWDSQGAPAVNQVNREFFSTLPQELNNAPWQTGIIEVTFYTSPETAAELAYVFEKF